MTRLLGKFTSRYCGPKELSCEHGTRQWASLKMRARAHSPGELARIPKPVMVLKPRMPKS